MLVFIIDCFLLEGKILKEIVKIDGSEVGVDKGEDYPVRVAQISHQLVHLRQNTQVIHLKAEVILIIGWKGDVNRWLSSKESIR